MRRRDAAADTVLPMRFGLIAPDDLAIEASFTERQSAIARFSRASRATELLLAAHRALVS